MPPASSSNSHQHDAHPTPNRTGPLLPPSDDLLRQQTYSICETEFFLVSFAVTITPALSHSQEAKKRAKEKAEAQKQVEAILAAAAGEGDGKSNAEGTEGGEAPGGAAVDPAKRAKALSKKIKKLETVKAKKDAGEAINAVGWGGGKRVGDIYERAGSFFVG